MKVLVFNPSDNTVQDVVLTEKLDLGLKRSFKPIQASQHPRVFEIHQLLDDTHPPVMCVYMSDTMLIIDRYIFDWFVLDSNWSMDIFKICLINRLKDIWKEQLLSRQDKTDEFIWNMNIIKAMLDGYLREILIKNPDINDRILIDSGMTDAAIRNHMEEWAV